MAPSSYSYADYRARSFWLEQASASYIESPALQGMARADVAVIGGGFTGISTAYHLKKDNPDMRVVVLESEVVGFGASGRSAGLVMSGFGRSLDAAVRSHGRQRVSEAHRYMERAMSYLGELVRDHHLECAYEVTGFLRVATTPARARRIQREIELAQSLGFDDVDWIDAQATRALIDSPTFLGAWREANGALLNPAWLVRGLKKLAVQSGVEIYEHSPVTQLDVARVIRAQTSHGAVESDKLVLATNAFSAQFRQVTGRQCPIHTYVVLTEPLNPAQRESIGWRERQGVEDARNLAHYFRLTPDNRLLVGGGDGRYFYGNRVDVDRHNPTFAQLQWFIADTFPGLRGIKITHRWGGPVSATADLAPLIGWVGTDRRIIFSVGCLGHGIPLAILNGQAISDLIGEKRTALTEVLFVNRSVLPLPSEPLRVFLANGILGVMRARDAFEERQGLGV